MWWEFAKWLGAGFFLIATVVLFSPKIAATSTIPWIMFFLGNILWVADMVRSKNVPWAVIGVVFAGLDLLLIYARITAFDIMPYLQPILDMAEKLI
jgi:hypothetical protein